MSQASAGAGPMELVTLSEAQNAAFDSEYHSVAEVKTKVAALRDLLPGGPRSLLDLGGGNGTFLDELLAAFPVAHGTNLDISEHLLSKNKPNQRKRLVHGSIGNLPALFPEEKFDVITINWVLHHLVGPTYGSCDKNRRATLEACRALLSPGGVIVVAENMFDGPGGANLPSWLIYQITSVQRPWLVRLFRRYFNTAGVGVCFLADDAWRRLYSSLGLHIARFHYGPFWPAGIKKRLMLSALMLKSQRHGHFYLQPAATV